MSDSAYEGAAQPSPPKFAPTCPFDAADADVILHTSDDVDFRLHRLVLSLASSFFKDMFGLPQPNSEPEIPVIPVSESARSLDAALRFWYPGAQPIVSYGLDDLREIFEILIMKYDIQFFVPAAQKQLLGFLHNPQNAVAVFSIACHLGWKDVAQQAAETSLKLPLRSFDAASERPAQLKHMSADAYHSLLQYHSECAKVAAAVTSSLHWANHADIPGIECSNWTDPGACPRTLEHWGMAHSTMAPLTAWFADYLEGATEALSKAPAARLDSTELLRRPITKMSTCSSCRVDGFPELMKFLGTMRSRIDFAIVYVELKLDF
ncbi:BTB domain-containing protein [Favolaschia claudopus]|uniref:BTB domain-containing protein n=1 Tax=Favolaschia claudopus TaxID=2862362 RepID=A0AAW0DZ43_9AGAR